jgi:hypothetical protein
VRLKRKPAERSAGGAMALGSWPLEPMHSTGWRHLMASRQGVLLRIRLTRHIDGLGHAGSASGGYSTRRATSAGSRTGTGRHLTIRWSCRGGRPPHRGQSNAQAAPQLSSSGRQIGSVARRHSVSARARAQATGRAPHAAPRRSGCAQECIARPNVSYISIEPRPIFR